MLKRQVSLQGLNSTLKLSEFYFGSEKLRCYEYVHFSVLPRNELLNYVDLFFVTKQLRMETELDSFFRDPTVAVLEQGKLLLHSPEIALLKPAGLSFQYRRVLFLASVALFYLSTT